MGFRAGAYAKVWDVKPRSDTMTSLRISISKKNKETGEYEQEFGGYVAAVGSAVAAKAAKLQVGDRIKLGDVDSCNKYNKEQQKEYRNDYIYSFEMADNNFAPAANTYVPQSPGSGEIEPPDEEDFDLPF